MEERFDGVGVIIAAVIVAITVTLMLVCETTVKRPNFRAQLEEITKPQTQPK